MEKDFKTQGLSEAEVILQSMNVLIGMFEGFDSKIAQTHLQGDQELLNDAKMALTDIAKAEVGSSCKSTGWSYDPVLKAKLKENLEPLFANFTIAGNDTCDVSNRKECPEHYLVGLTYASWPFLMSSRWCQWGKMKTQSGFGKTFSFFMHVS